MNLDFFEKNYKKTLGIYIIRNTINLKIYIGSAINLYKRLANHKTRLKNKKHINKHLQSACNKYGLESFVCELIEIVNDKEKLLEREQYYLDNLLFAQEFIRRENNKFQELGYNSYPTAQSPLGRIVTQETKDKISKTNTGKKQSKKTIKKRVKSITGIKKKPHTQEAKDKMSKKLKGRKAHNKGVNCSDEQKEQISKTLKEKYANGSIIHPNKGKKIDIRKQKGGALKKSLIRVQDKLISPLQSPIFNILLSLQQHQQLKK